MSPEEYELLLWIMGDRAFQINFVCAAIIGSWLTATFIKDVCTRFIKYLDYKLDYTFWNDLLDVEPS